MSLPARNAADPPAAGSPRLDAAHLRAAFVRDNLATLGRHRRGWDARARRVLFDAAENAGLVPLMARLHHVGAHVLARRVEVAQAMSKAVAS